MRICWLIPVALILLGGCGNPEVVLEDGEYFGYEPMENLSPEEDPSAFWFHASVLRVAGNRITMKQRPRCKSHGEVTSSASDGGFPEYEGKIELLGGRTIAHLRKVACDYCGVAIDEPLPSKIEREYVVRFISKGSFELDRIIYNVERNPSLEPGAAMPNTSLERTRAR
jgi:hypothetical protein